MIDLIDCWLPVLMIILRYLYESQSISSGQIHKFEKFKI